MINFDNYYKKTNFFDVIALKFATESYVLGQSEELNISPTLKLT